MRWFRQALIFAGVVALAYLGWVSVQRRGVAPKRQAPADPERARRQAEIDRIYGGSDLKILQFYSPTGDVIEGADTNICYGVLNAASVRMEPPVDGVGVSISRCVQVAPKRDTRYTLIATGRDGSVVSESFVIRTHPDPSTVPKIRSFQILRTSGTPGKMAFTLSFAVENAEEVSVEPPVIPTLYGAPSGQFYVAPRETTTYTLTAVGKTGRKVQKQLTVEVPPGG